MREREEALIRILVFIIAGIIIYFWTWVILVLALVNVILTLIQGKRMKEFYRFNELFIIELYVFWNYITGNSNMRPFPFNGLESLKEVEEKIRKSQKK